MVISDTSCMIDGFTIALLTAEFGLWASLGRAGIEKSHRTSGENLGLHNYAVADKGSINKAGIRK